MWAAGIEGGGEVARLRGGNEGRLADFFHGFHKTRAGRPREREVSEEGLPNRKKSPTDRVHRLG